MAKYPLVFIPDKLREIRQSYPQPKSLRNFPQEPRKELLPDYSSLETLVEAKVKKIEYRLPLTVIIFGLLYIYLTFNISGNKGALIYFSFIILIAVVICTWWLIQIPKENRIAKEKYQLEFKKYQKNKLLKKEEFNVKVDDYEKAKEKIENKYKKSIISFQEVEKPRFLYNLNIYENYLEQLSLPHYIADYRQRKSKEYLEKATREERVPKSRVDKIGRGVSELFFYKILEEEFGPHVRLDFGVKIDDKNVMILPDILVFNKSIGIYLAIEIDEPYIGSNGVPIHYIGNECDRDRIDTFNQNGWVVVKFAEEQVNREPFSCLEFIRNLAVDINKNSNYHKVKDFGIPLVETWTKDQAHQMAFYRYRNEYLMPSFRNLVSQEDNMPYKEIKVETEGNL